MAFNREDIGAFSLQNISIFWKSDEFHCWPDAVEDVDQDQEESDKQSHPARDNLRLDEEADPAHNHKHEAGQVYLKRKINNKFETFVIIYLN